MSDEPARASENHWRYILGACFTAYNLGCGFGFTSPSLAEIQVLKEGDEENTESREKIEKNRKNLICTKLI